jgi:hypothetical protein
MLPSRDRPRSTNPVVIPSLCVDWAAVDTTLLTGGPFAGEKKRGFRPTPAPSRARSSRRRSLRTLSAVACPENTGGKRENPEMQLSGFSVNWAVTQFRNQIGHSPVVTHFITVLSPPLFSPLLTERAFGEVAHRKEVALRDRGGAKGVFSAVSGFLYGVQNPCTLAGCCWHRPGP